MEPRPATAAAPELEDGTLLGNRYEITGAVARGPFGDVYRAVDRQIARVVAIRAIRPELLAIRGGPERLYAEIKKATKLDHKNIVKTIGLVTGDRLVAVVTQLVAGTSLRALIDERGPAPFSFKGAYNAIAHLANALGYAHHLTFHGGITARSVLVNRAGRIKLAEFGLATTFPGALAGSDPADRASLAPEVMRSLAAPDARADVYSLGALLFELLTGKPFAPGMSLRALEPSLPVELEGIVARLTGRAEDRPTSAEAVKQALVALIEKQPVSGQFAAMGGGQQRTTAQRQPPVSTPKPIVDPHESRWIVRKGKLDFGPYTLAQVTEQIAVDEVVPGNLLVDNETGEKISIEAHATLGALVMQAAHRRDDARRAHVEATVVKQDKRRGFALYAFIAAGAIALAGGGFALWRVLGAGGEVRQKTTDLLASADLAGLKVGSVRHLEVPPAPPKRPGAPRPPSQKGVPGGYDDSQSMDMGADGTGDERLDDSQINGVLGQHAGSLGRCLGEEVKRGGARRADIDFIVLGTGKVSAVRVNGETGTPLASCIRAAMQGMQFPSFNGPRTRASFPISL